MNQIRFSYHFDTINVDTIIKYGCFPGIIIYLNLNLDYYD